MSAEGSRQASAEHQHLQTTPTTTTIPNADSGVGKDSQQQQQQQQHQDRQQQQDRQQADIQNITPAAADSNTANTDRPENRQDDKTTGAAAAAAAAADQQATSNEQQNVKQFSDKSLQQLAHHYIDEMPAAQVQDTGFVVAGIAGRFPSADNMNELWHNLLNGHDMVRGPDDKRWPLGLWDLPKKAARIKDISRFDNEFFGIGKDTADYTDHQLRNLYEVIYESMLDAGINPASARGDSRTGIFFGFHTCEVENEFFEKPQFRTTGYQSQLLTQVADYFDIRGVVGSFDAACASSFAAFHQAVVNLKEGLIDTAIVCGVNISVRPGTSYQFLLLQMLSPTGSSKFLDASADGYAKTEACVSVILRRQDLARRNYASIVHTKCNNDGFKVEGITFPSSSVQEALMQGAIVEANVDPNQIVYVEAHGTGTPAGDPEEARAIAKVYCGPDRSEPLLIGSVKSNMGHAEGVSGLCSLAKVICTFENELLPRNLHYHKPNPNIEPLVEGRLKPVDQNIPFKHNLIPMNCYGFGGVNVHGIFKSVTKRRQVDEAYDIAPNYPRLVTMFGRSQAALEFAFAELKKKDFDCDEVSVTSDMVEGDIPDQLSQKRILTRDYLALLDSINEGPIDRLMNYRGYLLIDNNLNELASDISQIEVNGPLKRDELLTNLVKDDKLFAEKLRLHLQATERPEIHYQDMKRGVWFLMAGLGCQWRAMGAQLQNFEPFWKTILPLAETLKQFNVDLIDILTNDDDNIDKFDNSNVNLFVSIVATQIALIDLLNLLGVKADRIVGHSIGEISCAYADKLLSASDTIKLAYYLAKPIDDAALHDGAMLAVSLSEKQAEKQLAQFDEQHLFNSEQDSNKIEIACINGDESVTLAGPVDQIDALAKVLTDDNIYARRVSGVKTAFHSSALRKIEKQMLESAQVLFNNNNNNNNNTTNTNNNHKLEANNWLSSSRDELKTSVSKFEINAQYFVDNLCSPVRFKQLIDKIDSQPTNDNIVIEIAPHKLFQPILKQKYLTKLNYVSLMKRNDGSINSLLSSLGQLYQLGQPLALSKLYPKVEFPVAKGTASLSSLIKWNHSQQFHVAKYPEAFRKPPCEARVKFDLIDESDKYLAGHCIDGRILFPATGYLYLVWRSFSLTHDKVGNSALLTKQAESQLVPVEFTNVRLYRATILGSAPVELMVRLEEATGQFEVREGGSVVADGFISTPKVNPNGLQYEAVRDIARQKKRDLSLTTDDVYKQFRVNGYDYGESFRNITSASVDGLHIQVKWTGQFIPFSDSVLQSLFLAICKRTSALFLPTKFEYMRINPALLQAKVDEALANNQPCILDAFCELETGIIVTDGIEMRGVGASPAPRRLQQEPLMESYQFVSNLERQISDLLAQPVNSKVSLYKQMCSTAAYKILANLNSALSAEFAAATSSSELVDDDALIKYLDDNDSSESHVLLSILDGILAAQEQPEEPQVSRGGLDDDDDDEPGAGDKLTNDSDETGSQQQSDHKDKDKDKEATTTTTGAAASGPQRKRVPQPLLRPADELQKSFEETVKSQVSDKLNSLGLDVLSLPFSAERFVRPFLETVLENTPSQTIKMLELNTGSSIKHESVVSLLSEIAPNTSVNYFLAHADHSVIKSSSLPQDAKLYKWSPANKSLARELQDVDFVLYSDTSCHPTINGQFDVSEVARDDNGDEIKGAASVVLSESLNSVFASVSDALRPNGFFMIMLRTDLSPAEKLLYKINNFSITQTSARLEQVMSAASSFKEMRLVLDKSHTDGCHLLMFRKLDDSIEIQQNVVAVHVEHNKSNEWLELLKKFVNDSREQDSKLRSIWVVANDGEQNGALGLVNCLRREPGGEKVKLLLDLRQNSPFSFPKKTIEFEKTVKVDASVDQNQKAANDQKTAEQPATGATGGAKEQQEDQQQQQQVEKKEPCSSASLIDLEQLEKLASQQQQADPLVELIKTDLAYNCFDSSGKYGSFRHFTIADILDTQKTETSEAYVNVATRGDLSSFKWYEAPYKYIPADVRQNNLISIYYSSLNFRDIMLASGRLPLDALPVSVALSECILGLEFSGRAPDGTRIAGMLGGRGIGTTAVVYGDCSICFKIPETMSLEEAATIPVVYATVVMALIHRGRMQSGESILIHSGSGGVGQAAIRLCLYYGLTVYTTTGNQEKRDFLKQEFPQLTDAHIFNSRDCSFETDIMRATGGRGVDLILNSLSEDKLQASIRCLANGGRFLEIGKYDMALNNPIELLKLDTNKTFHGILLDKLFDTETLTENYRKQTEELTRFIEKGLFEGWILPIKRTVFDKTQVEDAFRFMASGKHIGKVMLKMRDEETTTTTTGAESLEQQQLSKYSNCIKPTPVFVKAIPRTMFNPQLSYIITGGLGGFGLELSKWMTINGARNIVLTSRSGIKTGYQQLVVDRLEENNVKVIVSTVDNSTDIGAQQLIEEALSLAPVGGIFNLAMVLRDSLFENSTVDAFEQVSRPKVLGVAALDRVSRKLCPQLELFVAFSSISCGKGNPGQTNYGYANSTMERICELRRRDNLHGLAIQWGAIGDVGVAFEHMGGNEAVIGGTIPQRLPSCFSTLSKFITSPFTTCLSVLQADRRSFNAGKKGDLVKTILHVLGIKDPASVDPNCTLGELGLDSLMAVEIRQALEREYEIVLTVQEIRALTINRIREIGDGKGKSDSQATGAAGGENSALQSGTDELGLTAAQQANVYQTETKVTLSESVVGVTISQAANGQRVFLLDKTVASRPPLALPLDDLVLLNGLTGNELAGNPIFFLPPIQGDFARLSVLSKKIRRPCVGINWTKTMAHLDNVDDVARAHISVIRKYYPNLKVLDLVGYSFGAAIAFEIARQAQISSVSSSSSSNGSQLNVGKLVLLDGSPAQINIGVRYITNTLDTKDESARAAEIMTVFLMQYSRFDYATLKKQVLAQQSDEAKLKFTADLLAKALGIKDSEQAKQLQDAEEAYCRRFQIMLKYEPSNVKLDNDVTLIRATEVYVSKDEHSVEEDYGLSANVSGRVNSCLIKGNHESFLDDNVEKVGSLIQDVICPVLD